ncbi:MAG: helix-turn-helix domain-containing protein, partial [Bacteroidota bacterium]
MKYLILRLCEKLLDATLAKFALKNYPLGHIQMIAIHSIPQIVLIFIIWLTGILLYKLPQSKKKQNLPFCLFLFLIGLHVLTDLTVDYPIFGSHFVHLIPSVFIFLYAPLLYFHAEMMLQQTSKFSWQHFVLFGVFILLYQFTGFVKEIFFPIYFLQYIFYLFLIQRLLIKEDVTTGRSLRRSWIKFTFYFFGSIWILAFAANIAGAQKLDLLSDFLEITSYVCTIVFIVVMLYFIPSHLNLFRSIQTLAKEEGYHSRTPLNEQQKYFYSKLEDHQLKQLKVLALQQLENEKVFLDPEYKIATLAKSLKVSTNELSQAINEGFGYNFHHLINSYRVKEVKSLLQDQKMKHYTLLAIGMQAGFNSKTTFNTVFKKMTGLTPSQYKKNLETGLIQKEGTSF